MEGPDPYGAEYQLPISDLDLWSRYALCLVFPDNCSLKGLSPLREKKTQYYWILVVESVFFFFFFFFLHAVAEGNED